MIEGLGKQWPSLKQLSQADISDIVSGNQKVAGTSLFRSRNYLQYQASILVSIDRPLVEQCLQHPSKEPDYRQGCGHGSFLTSLQEVEPMIANEQAVVEALQRHLGDAIKHQCDGHLLAAQSDQFRSLEKRIAQAEALPKA